MSKMLEEIRQQPAALERTLRSEIRRTESLRKLLAAKKPRMIVLAARGTSDNAAQFGRYLLELTTGIPVSLAAPSIYTLYSAPVQLNDALVVGISQSGESTDTNFVVQRAREAGAFTVGITNERQSALAKIAEHVLLVHAEKEKSVAATKTYTGQLLALYLLAYALGADLSLDRVRRIPEWAGAALKLESEIAERAERYRFMRQSVVIGRGLNYSNAFEFALKLMETCYVVAERFSAADLLHGPIAMVESGFPAFLFTPAGVTWPGMKELADKLAELKAETMIVTDRSNPDAAKGRRALTVPVNLRETKPFDDLFTPIPYIIPAQLFAASLAAVKGLNPDHPRTLEKVTRTL
jgi:glucosamine--fructose-6-phosphate aminotransferase (isomerizing)